MTQAQRSQPIVAGDIMRTEVLTVSAMTPLRDLARLLSDYRISGAPVTDEAGHIIGVVSMRDLMERYVEGAEIREREMHEFYDLGSDDDDEIGATVIVPDDAEDTVEDVMTAQVHTVVRGASLAQVARRMVELKVHRIIVEENGKHVGLITTFDVLEAVAGRK